MIVWMIGLSGAGKTTIAREVARQWRRHVANVVLLDGDDVRGALGPLPGGDPYSLDGRRLQAERVTGLCRLLDQQGIHVVCALLSVFPELGAVNRGLFSRYLEVYIDTPLDVCMRRDTKDLYKPALTGMRRNVVGIDLAFRPPRNPDLVLHNGVEGSDPRELARVVVRAALQDSSRPLRAEAHQGAHRGALAAAPPSLFDFPDPHTIVEEGAVLA